VRTVTGLVATELTRSEEISLSIQVVVNYKVKLQYLHGQESQFSRYLLINVGSFKKDKHERADDV
jgi:hypothetical protein